MTMEWIATYGSSEMMTAQISFLSEGGSGAPVPDLSIRGRRSRRGPCASEERKDPDRVWPGRRALGGPSVFVRDPFGKLVNILAHGRQFGSRDGAVKPGRPVVPNPGS